MLGGSDVVHGASKIVSCVVGVRWKNCKSGCEEFNERKVMGGDYAKVGRFIQRSREVLLDAVGPCVIQNDGGKDG